MSFLRKTAAASAALFTLSAPVAAAEHAPMSGISPYAHEAIQMLPYRVPVPWDTPGSPYRQLKECAHSNAGTSSRFLGADQGLYLAAVSCVLFNPMLNGALDRQMRDVAGR